VTRKLHIGSGPERLEGWVNIDLLPYPGVDRVLDVTRPIPERDVDFIFAEHFLEHLSLRDGIAFLRESRRCLNDDGVIRLSTPNLDWVVATQYQPGRWTGNEDAVRDCVNLNRGFRGWGHAFLYNEATMRRVLNDCGFARVIRCDYGESAQGPLRGLERHERSDDSPDLPHVLIIEASGRAPERDLAAEWPQLAEYNRDVHMPWHALQYAALWSTRLLSRILRSVGLRDDSRGHS
jgi:Uncharacterized protein conserved in bacteria